MFTTKFTWTDVIIKTVVTYMDLSALCAVAKCLVCWWFPDKLALSNLTGLGAVVIPTDCLTDCGFRSRTSWTHWLGKKPFFPRRRPSNIPLLSSPLVTEMEKNGELVNWWIGWFGDHFIFASLTFSSLS